MEKVEIFWRDGCGFCSRVQSLFTMKGVKYESYNIWESEEQANLMKKRHTKETSVQQV